MFYSHKCFFGKVYNFITCMSTNSFIFIKQKSNSLFSQNERSCCVHQKFLELIILAQMHKHYQVTDNNNAAMFMQKTQNCNMLMETQYTMQPVLHSPNRQDYNFTKCQLKVYILPIKTSKSQHKGDQLRHVHVGQL